MVQLHLLMLFLTILMKPQRLICVYDKYEHISYKIALIFYIHSIKRKLLRNNKILLQENKNKAEAEDLNKGKLFCIMS